MAGSAGVRARLWDAPVRLVHWLLVALLAFSWWSGEEGRLQWHRWSGYTVAGLLVFRIFWGFAGGGAARFASFVRGPRATIAYARTLFRRAPSDVPGHNPLGAWSVLAMLAVLAVQVTTGLLSVDVDGFESGPMSHLVSFETGRSFAEIHDFSFHVLQALVALHVAAVLFYLLYKRTDLITPMITGRRALPADPGLAGAPARRLILGALISAAAAWAISKGLFL